MVTKNVSESRQEETRCQNFSAQVEEGLDEILEQRAAAVVVVAAEPRRLKSFGFQCSFTCFDRFLKMPRGRLLIFSVTAVSPKCLFLLLYETREASH